MCHTRQANMSGQNSSRRATLIPWSQAKQPLQLGLVQACSARDSCRNLLLLKSLSVCFGQNFCLCVHECSVASYHAEGCTTKQDGLSQECSHRDGLCSWCGPTLQLWQGRELAGSCICKPPAQRTMGSQAEHSQSDHLAVLTSCALALLGTCCTANTSACCISALCCGDGCHRPHCACGPTLPAADANTLQRLDVW